MKVLVIDVGGNSVKFLIMSIGYPGRVRDDEMARVRLSDRRQIILRPGKVAHV